MEIPFVPNLMSVLTATNVVSDVLRQKALDAMNDNGSDEGLMLNIMASAGSNITLPFHLSSPITGDSVRLILWFKDSAEKPIYSLDARDKTLNEAVHWSDTKLLDYRAYLHLNDSSGSLKIERLQIHDAGIYLCRVDSKIQPSRITTFNLSISAPPEKPKIYTSDGKEVRLKLGPYRIGQSVTVKCEVLGGMPSPEVSWWRDNILIDYHSEEKSKYKVTNQLTIKNIHRSDLNSILTCQAKNSNGSLPVTTSVKLDMTFGPESLYLEGLNNPMSAGQGYTIKCVAVGSRPAPAISWWNSNTLINGLETKFESKENGNITSSTISFLAPSDWDNNTISCRAGLPGQAYTALHATKVLDIQYMNSAQLSIEPSSKFKKGNQVHLNCLVDANPPPFKIIWEKEGIPVDGKTTRMANNKTLVISNVDYSSSGNYTCIPHNMEGSVVSNSVLVECISCIFQEDLENKQKMSSIFIKSDKADDSEQFDYEFSKTSPSNDTKKKGNRSLSFIENDQEGEKPNMSRWNIILLGTAVVGFASIVITVTCLVCFCCILNKRKNRQKNQTQYCSPDILMNVAGASTCQESFIDCVHNQELQTFQFSPIRMERKENTANKQRRNESPSVNQEEIMNSSPLRESGIKSLSVISNNKPTLRMPKGNGICSNPASPKMSTFTSLGSVSHISFSNNQMNMYGSNFPSVLTLSRETIV